MVFGDPAPLDEVIDAPKGAPNDPSPPAAEPSEMDAEGPGSHVDRRGLVFERFRLFYVPIPKAGCTALLWALARLARVPEDRFAGAMGREVSRSMTIHAMGRWPESFRFGERMPEDRARVLAEDGWLRFTVGRNPFRRLWSAWQSKILLAEPQFIEKFSSEPWFPGRVGSAAEVVEGFRSFLGALRADPDLVHSDVHWAPQTDVIEYPQIAYDHLGRVEDLDDTVALIREHVSANKGASLPDLPRANVTPLPYSDALFTGEDVRFLGQAYAEDMKVFGYETPAPEAGDRAVPEEWLEKVDGVATALAEMRERNLRVGDLHHLLQARRDDYFEMRRQKRLEEKLRREEHRRNQRLQKRLRWMRRRIDWMESRLTWRLTVPFRKVSGAARRLRGTGGR